MSCWCLRDQQDGNGKRMEVTGRKDRMEMENKREVREKGKKKKKKIGRASKMKQHEMYIGA